MLTGHKPGCWLGNGGPRCTCARGLQTKYQRKTNFAARPYGFEEGDEMLNKLMTFDPHGGIQIEDAMVLAAFARALDSEYEALNVPKPSNLDEKIEALRRFIAESQREARRKAVAELKARRASLATAEEKRVALDKQIAELEAQLA